MATGNGEADRDTVLGWMARTGKGYAVAADHFALPENRVKQWVRRDRLKKKAGTQGTHAGTPEPDDASGKSDGLTGGEEKGGSKRIDPLGASRARPPNGPTAASFPEQDRERLRGAVRRGLDVLDSEAGWKDPKKAADAARALKELMTMTPDLLTFDQRTSGEADKGLANEVEGLAAAFGVTLRASA